jgi:hypothetical protein
MTTSFSNGTCNNGFSNGFCPPFGGGTPNWFFNNAWCGNGATACPPACQPNGFAPSWPSAWQGPQSCPPQWGQSQWGQSQGFFPNGCQGAACPDYTGNGCCMTGTNTWTNGATSPVWNQSPNQGWNQGWNQAGIRLGIRAGIRP